MAMSGMNPHIPIALIAPLAAPLATICVAAFSILPTSNRVSALEIRISTSARAFLAPLIPPPTAGPTLLYRCNLNL